MLYMQPMSRVRVLCHQNAIEKSISALYEFGAIQIKQSKDFGPQKPLPVFQEISTHLVQLRGMERALNLSDSREARETELGGLFQQINGLHSIELEELRSRKQELASQLQEAKDKIIELEPFTALTISTRLFSGNPRLSFAFIEFKDKAKLNKAFHGIASDFLFASKGKNNFALIAFDTRKEKQANEAIQKTAERVFSIPECNSSSFQAESDRLHKAKAGIGKELQAVDKAINEWAAKNGKTLVLLRKNLELHAKKAELPMEFTGTKHLVAIEGWVASKKVKALERGLKSLLGSAFVLEELEFKEMPPSQPTNPSFLEPFEKMVAFYSMPRFDELDPSFLVAIAFPLFFGMIMGDIGHGLMALVLGLVLYFKGPKAFKPLWIILMISAVSAIVFGFIYAEFFGFTDILGYKLTPVIHRLHAEGLEILLGLVIAIAFVQLALGYVLGIINALSHKHTKHAIAKASWLLVEIGLFMALSTALDVAFFLYLRPVALAAPVLLWVGLLAIGALGLIITEGVITLFEIPSLFANVFSYLRIMALGLSAAILALLVDKLAPAWNGSDPVSIIVFLLFAIVFAVAHFLAMALAVLESSIQSVRLQYVEFFSKFYKGGGIPFTPLRAKKG
ncbi:MAG: V-type ATP synthase subunit I [Candidatus Micrarchaeota archaeon]